MMYPFPLHSYLPHPSVAMVSTDLYENGADYAASHRAQRRPWTVWPRCVGQGCVTVAAGRAFGRRSLHSRRQLHTQASCDRGGCLGARCNPLVKAFERTPDAMRWAGFEQLPWRRAQDQHVFHARGTGEHHVKVQPPSPILHPCLPDWRVPCTVNRDARANRLSLRGR